MLRPALKIKRRIIENNKINIILVMVGHSGIHIAGFT